MTAKSHKNVLPLQKWRNAFVKHHLGTIGALEHKVIQVLAHHAGNETCVAWPSLAAICKEAGCTSSSKICGALKALAKKGIVKTWGRCRRGNGKWWITARWLTSPNLDTTEPSLERVRRENPEWVFRAPKGQSPPVQQVPTNYSVNYSREKEREIVPCEHDRSEFPF